MVSLGGILQSKGKIMMVSLNKTYKSTSIEAQTSCKNKILVVSLIVKDFLRPSRTGKLTVKL